MVMDMVTSPPNLSAGSGLTVSALNVPSGNFTANPQRQTPLTVAFPWNLQTTTARGLLRITAYHCITDAFYPARAVEVRARGGKCIGGF